MEQPKSKKTKLFVGLIGSDTTNKSLRSFFEQFVDIHIAKVEISRRSGKKKGFGYVICNTVPREGLKLPSVLQLDGKKVLVSHYEDALTSAWHDVRSQSIRVTISNIPDYASESEVVQLLERFGIVLLSNFACGDHDYESECSRVLRVELVNTSSCCTYLEMISGRKVDFTINQILEFWDLKQHSSQINSKYDPSQLNLSNLCEIFGLTKPSKPTIDPVMSQIILHKKDKHSKYEFIANTRKISSTNANYRFNIVVPDRLQVELAVIEQQRKTSQWGSVLFKSMRTLPSQYLVYREQTVPNQPNPLLLPAHLKRMV